MTEKTGLFVSGCVAGFMIAMLALSLFSFGYKVATGKDVMQALREAR